MLLRDLRVGVHDVAEIDRRSRARRLASGHHLAVGDRPTAVAAGGDLCLFDPLHTVRAFFHHAAAANGDLGVQHQLLQLAIRRLDRPREGLDPVADADVFVVVEVVKAADLERTVVRTVPGTDAPVVGHRVEPLVGVDRRGDRAHLFARGGLAVHARDRLLHDFGVLFVPLEVTVDPQPMHFPAVGDLFFTDDRDVVFALASDDAGVAADALVQVDRHPPLWDVRFVFADPLDRLLERRSRPLIADRRDVRPFRLGELGDLLEQPLGPLADQREAAIFRFLTAEFVDRPVVLGRRQFVLGIPGSGFDAVGNQGSVRGP